MTGVFINYTVIYSSLNKILQFLTTGAG